MIMRLENLTGHLRLGLMSSFYPVAAITAATALLLTLSLLSSTVQALELTAESIEHLPAEIHQVQSGGYWANADEEGFFRAVVTAAGVEHVSHSLYIQWLKVDSSTQGYVLVRTVLVKELSSTHGNHLKISTSFDDVNLFRIDAEIHSRDGNRSSHIITVKGDGKYVIDPDN